MLQERKREREREKEITCRIVLDARHCSPPASSSSSSSHAFVQGVLRLHRAVGPSVLAGFSVGGVVQATKTQMRTHAYTEQGVSVV